tara:strand:- start:956 stop:1726 length:771 start_codon:yes stop_codon:yes gene_type:complete
MNILITGGNGYIGNTLYNALKDTYNIISISRDNFDLTCSDATRIFFQHRLFDVVIHCAISGGSRLKPDDSTVLDNNMRMYYNLYNNKSHFTKFINFGSGAELYNQDTLYGFSKSVIRQSILNNENFYNLRLYAVFDENELDTRFIKANIKKYIEKQQMIIHQDKYMSFFYMKDLITLVKYYIDNQKLEKEINCCYKEIYSLEKIAQLINDLGEHKVEVKKQIKDIGSGYYGVNLFQPDIEFLGLKNGIREVYNKLK